MDKQLHEIKDWAALLASRAEAPNGSKAEMASIAKWLDGLFGK